MEKPLFISEETPSNAGLDFESLKELGIQYIQELTGAFWTDYNDHDPGITILEQLCYAITDLVYRSELNIEDLIHSQSSGDMAFYPPEDILPCNALTIQDYRKLFLDESSKILNAWLFKADDQENTLAGLYNVYLDLDLHKIEPLLSNKVDEARVFQERIQAKKEVKEVIRQIREAYCQNRNLCEDVLNIFILQPLPITFFADIELDTVEEIEQTMAHIYFKIDQHLNPRIPFYSLQEIQEKTKALDSIFEGPRLKNGFIESEDLLPKLDKVVISEIIKIIMEVPEVVSVKNIYLKVDEDIYDNQLNIPKGFSPKLLFTSSPDNQDYTISFLKGGIHYDAIDPVLFERKRNEIESAHKRVYRADDTRVQIPRGRKIDIQEYFSIQNQFPLIYGIGEFGLPGKPNTERRAQAKQLKAYLLIFEQVLANYLAQLAHIRDLFSLKNHVSRTYFYQYLDNVPNIGPLLKKEKGDLKPDIILGDVLLPNDYKKGLDTLMKTHDDYAGRRNRMLDFLLAIHGENLSDYTLAYQNYYSDAEGQELELIYNKSRLLEYLPGLNQNRARAYNYLEDSIEDGNISGLEARVGITLGLHMKFLGQQHTFRIGKHPIHETIRERKGLRITHPKEISTHWDNWSKAQDIRAHRLSQEVIEESFDFVDDEDLKPIQLSEEELKEYRKYSILGETKVISYEILQKGLDLRNYRIGQVGYLLDDQGELVPVDTHETPPFFILYKSPDQGKYSYIGRYEDEDQAHAGLKAFLTEVRQINQLSESMYLVEHILLRPDTQDKRFGIYLLDEEGNYFLRSESSFNFEERIQVIRDLKPYLYDKFGPEQERVKRETEEKNYFYFTVKQRDKDSTFEIVFQPRPELKFVSVKSYESAQEAHEEMDSLVKYLADLEYASPFDRKYDLFVFVPQKLSKSTQGEGQAPALESSSSSPQDAGMYKLVPEDFYNFRISVIFPEWTVRFRDPEFRKLVERIIHENKPANVSAQILWLDYYEMTRFESNYYHWAKDKRVNGMLDKSVLDERNRHFSWFLLELYARRDLLP